METDPPNERPLVPEKEGNYSRENLARCFIFPALGGFLYGYDIGATAVALDDMGSEQWSGTSWHAAAANSVVRAPSLGRSWSAGAGVAARAPLRDGLGPRQGDAPRVGALRRRRARRRPPARGPLAPPPDCVSSSPRCLRRGHRLMHGAPTYIETAPPSIRGALVSAKEAIIVLGPRSATPGARLRTGAGRWRYIYWVAMVFAAAMAYGLSGVPGARAGARCAATRTRRWRTSSRRARAGAFERLAGHVRALKADEVGPQSIPEIVENLTSTPASAYGLARVWGPPCSSRSRAGGTRVIQRRFNVSARAFRKSHGPPVLYYVTEIFEDYDLGVGASIGLSAWKLVATMLTVGYGPVT
ncbi:hypothetical protein JL720_8995 [Aureococcus anophagefferens]|nr:hypothetical protein JL720_8995 [Aureococcus anophagefferens]